MTSEVEEHRRRASELEERKLAGAVSILSPWQESESEPGVRDSGDRGKSLTPALPSPYVLSKNFAVKFAQNLNQGQRCAN